MVVAHCQSAPDALDALPGAAQSTLQRMQAAVRVLIEGVGEDTAREGLLETPRRVARAWLDMAEGYSQECKSAFGTALFHEPIVSVAPGGLVLVRDITFAGLSESTLLPFHGRCHIAYVPRGGVVLGLSKLARAAKCLAARVQTQQEFTQALLAAVDGEVAPAGAAVVVQASHLGYGPAPLQRATSAACGCFQDPGSGLLTEFMALLRLAGGPQATASPATLADGACGRVEGAKQPQPQVLPLLERGFTASSVPWPGSHAAMVHAAEVLLEGVGEDPSRPGLAASCRRYVDWLHSATAGYRMALPCAADLGPATPDEHSPGHSDASSDDMSESNDCAACPSCGCCSGSHSGVNGRAAGTPCPTDCGAGQWQQQRGGAVTFSARFASQCEHHLLPFYGVLRLAYLPGSSGGAAVARSPSQGVAALAHVVEMYSRRLQVQERLTNQVAEAALRVLGAEAVLVVVESAHMCMVARGVEKHASTTLTTAARGAWTRDAAARSQALALLLAEQAQQEPPAPGL